jgi:aspartate/methionine/tyrosine aminotransferase
VNARVLVDEVYLEAFFEHAPPPATSLGPEFVVTSSLTKGYGLSGLRCGWILADAEIAKEICLLDDIFGASAPLLMEQLSVSAIAQLPKIAARAKLILETNRRTLADFLRTRRDLEAVSTNGGTTSFPRVLNVDVDKLCEWLITKYETNVVPGRFFESPQHVRIGLCCEPVNFSAGIKCLGNALDELKKTAG